MLISKEDRERLKSLRISDFYFTQSISTRWMDNDAYGHVNNAVYYSFFDTVVNTFLIEKIGLAVPSSDTIGLVVGSNCQYFAPVSYPDSITASLRVESLGNSSVTYGIGIFKESDETLLAYGNFVHVFVTREDSKPVQIPEFIRAGLEKARV